MITYKGIDVSEHNGVIDWDKVKADGVNFAMIRMGYGGDYNSQDDKQFERNVKECERVGIKWGAYLYSYALNVVNAKSEVQHALRLLKGKKPSYPIAFDMEDADHYKQKHGMPSNAALVDICDTFLSAIQKEGYYPILYASLHWLDNQLKNSKLDKYDKWVAQWADKCTYSGKYSLWQLTSSGIVKGINGRVDINYSYVDFGKKDDTVEKNSDIKGHWAEKDIQNWLDRKIFIGGDDGKFSPDENLTRAELCVVLSRLIENGYLNDPTLDNK